MAVESRTPPSDSCMQITALFWCKPRWLRGGHVQLRSCSKCRGTCGIAPAHPVRGRGQRVSHPPDLAVCLSSPTTCCGCEWCTLSVCHGIMAYDPYHDATCGVGVIQVMIDVRHRVCSMLWAASIDIRTILVFSKACNVAPGPVPLPSLQVGSTEPCRPGAAGLLKP